MDFTLECVCYTSHPPNQLWGPYRDKKGSINLSKNNNKKVGKPLRDHRLPWMVCDAAWAKSSQPEPARKENDGRNMLTSIFASLFYLETVATGPLAKYSAPIQ